MQNYHLQPPKYSVPTKNKRVTDNLKKSYDPIVHKNRQMATEHTRSLGSAKYTQVQQRGHTNAHGVIHPTLLSLEGKLVSNRNTLGPASAL